MNHSAPSSAQRGSLTDSPAPVPPGAESGRPATTVTEPSTGPVSSAARPATHNSVPSQGMSGCDHCSQQSRAPSGESLGSDTKSVPETSTRGARRPETSSTTISFTTAAGPPPAGWCSRTSSAHRPSAVTQPSAQRSPRGISGSGVMGTGGSDPVRV